MDQLKTCFSKTLLRLRTEAGMTQTELGDRLNYSDKTVSKWERGEAIPDAAVLKKIGAIFGVSVDELLSEEGPKPAEPEEEPVRTDGGRFSKHAVTHVALTGVLTAAVIFFVIWWIVTGELQWLTFVYAVPAALIALLVLNSVWNGGKHNFWIVSGLVLTLIAVPYLTLLKRNPWQLFLILVPAEFVVFFSFRIRNRKK